AASSAATSADGLWKEPMHGSGSFADCWFVTSICSPFTTPSFTLPASGLHSGGIFETSSKHPHSSPLATLAGGATLHNRLRYGASSRYTANRIMSGTLRGALGSRGTRTARNSFLTPTQTR